MTHPVTLPDLALRIAALPRDQRHLIAIAGPPASGKSTLADGLVEALNDATPGRAAVLPMDGFHYDDAVLEARGLRPRKGAPETFDTAGFLHLLTRLRDNIEPEIAVPVFDRDLEISRAAARIIPQSVDLLVVEGNYLLLNAPGWRDLAPLFDLSVALDVSEAELRRRLEARWRAYDLDPAEITRRVEQNDLPNGLTVIARSRPADLVLF